MKKHIHPTYNNIKAICSCGNIISIHSTLTKPVSIDACNRCHPFYTGKQRVLDTAGRVERFNKRFNRS